MGKGDVPVPMGRGDVMPVGYGWATMMGEAAARAERAARRRVLVCILVVCWGLTAFGGVVDFDPFLWCFWCSKRQSSVI